MAKYDPLRAHLGSVPAEVRSVVLSHEQLEAILGFSLPRSARDHQAWWSNTSPGSRHTHAQSWTRAGFRVDSTVDAVRGRVRLVRG